MRAIALIVTKKPMEHSINHYGSLEEVEDKQLRVLDATQSGDCLCLLPGDKGIIMVKSEDIGYRKDIHHA